MCVRPAEIKHERVRFKADVATCSLQLSVMQIDDAQRSEAFTSITVYHHESVVPPSNQLHQSKQLRYHNR